MRTLRILSLILAVCCLGGIAAAQDEAEMQAMMEAGSPGEHHEHLAMMAGTWDYDLKMWNPGEAEPAMLSGTVTSEAMLGGRFIHSIWGGEFMGMPFTGVGVDGYNNVTGEYSSIWMDNFGTGMLVFSGSCSDGGKVRTMSGTFVDPMMGVEVTDTGTSTVNDDGTVLMQTMRKLPDGTEYKMMEISMRPAS